MGAVRILPIGTTPLLVLPYNVNRTALRVSFLPTSVVAANLGLVNVGIGIVPDAAQGNPTSGDPLNPGSELVIREDFVGDPSVPEESIWLVADRAAQVVLVEEDAFDPLTPERIPPVQVVSKPEDLIARIAPRALPVPRVDRGPLDQLPTPGTIPPAKPGEEIGIGPRPAGLPPPGAPPPAPSGEGVTFPGRPGTFVA